MLTLRKCMRLKSTGATMPNKCEKMRIPRELDRRRRVTPEMADHMRAMYADGVPLRAIAREFGVCHKTVKLNVDPEYRARQTEAMQTRKPWLLYYDRERWRELMKNHRHYKRELELAGKLTPKPENGLDNE